MFVKEFMELAVQKAHEGIEAGAGGPFGAVIVMDNEVVGVGHNEVLSSKDPTAHGEIVAIRNACKNLNTHDLSNAELYTTGEPCPMCLNAIMWAGIKTIYYAKTLRENSLLGFNDTPFYDATNQYLVLGRNPYTTGVYKPIKAADVLFDEYDNMDKELY